MKTRERRWIIKLWSFAILILAACATPYQQIGSDPRGGFYSQRIAENRFVISFSGNGFTSGRTASDYCLLRAAEVALEHNFSYFSIDGLNDISQTSELDLGTTTTTNGYVSSFGGFSATTTSFDNKVPIFKPGSRLYITCYENPPANHHAGTVYAATLLAEKIRDKYKLKENESSSGLYGAALSSSGSRLPPNTASDEPETASSGSSIRFPSGSQPPQTDSSPIPAQESLADSVEANLRIQLQNARLALRSNPKDPQLQEDVRNLEQALAGIRTPAGN